MNTLLPSIALSVRQPWSWAIIHAGKDIENRSWQAVNRGLGRRGRICVHAAKGMTRSEYYDARDFMRSIGVICPPPGDLVRGGIIGTVDVVDVVTESTSRWFFGPRGLVLRDAQAISPFPVQGALGFFDWHRLDTDSFASPAKWMQPEPTPDEAQKPQMELLS